MTKHFDPEAFGAAMGELIVETVAPLKERIAELEQRLAGLEAARKSDTPTTAKTGGAR